MGSCLCVNNKQGDVLINKEKSSQIDFTKEVSQEDKKFKSDLETSKSIPRNSRKPRRPTKNLSCDQFWEDVRKEKDLHILTVKNDGIRPLDIPLHTLPRVMTYQTNSKYSIKVFEVVDKIIDPNEVFYFENKDIRPRSPRPSENNKNRPKSSTKSAEIEKKITESIINNNNFDKLYEEVLSKHLCKK